MALAPQGMQQSKSDGVFLSTDDILIGRQIQGTHAPDGWEVDAKPLLHVIEDILYRVSPILSGIVQTTQAQPDAIEDKPIQSSFTDMHGHLAYAISKISCEIACKCSDGGDADAATLRLFNTLSCYSWDAKVVIGLAALAVNYGEFCLVAGLYPSNPLAKSVAILKQLPDMLERDDTWKAKFEALPNLIKAMMNVTKCIVAFKELPSLYITLHPPEMVTATDHIPTAAYWTIRSIIACASQIMDHEYATSTTEVLELSRLANKVNDVCSHLLHQKNLCYRNAMRYIESYQTLERLFYTPQIDNLKILKALIYTMEDHLQIFDAHSKNWVPICIDSLKEKYVILFISDLDLSDEELSFLKQMYLSRKQPHYEVVWLPVVDWSTPGNENKQKLETLRGKMPWHLVFDPSLLDLAVIGYIKKVWKFNKKPQLVVLDPQGKVVNFNAIHMMWIWGNSAFPFNSSREDALWKEGTRMIDLLALNIDPVLFNWIKSGEKYICFYGGEDLKWIKEFTSTLEDVATDANIQLKMLYVGKSNRREKVDQIIQEITKSNATILNEKLINYTLRDSKQVSLFWVRLESMWHCKLQHDKSVENDQIMQEITKMLSFDGSDQGWAVISGGSAEMAKAKDETILNCLKEYKSWKEHGQQKGFMHALNHHLPRTSHHCNRLILPWTTGIIPEKVFCPDCKRPMEKFIMYRCCND